MVVENSEKPKDTYLNDEVSLPERYRILIQARNFHFDNFNKWMTYFYVATGALFLGYCTIVTSGKNVADKEIGFLQFSILLLGYVVSILWYWSSKGYYYWNINFIELVNYYEETVLNFSETQRVYKVFFDKDKENYYFNPTRGGNFSTSRIAIFFAFVVSTFWGTVMHYLLLSDSFLFKNYFKLSLPILHPIGEMPAWRRFS